MSNEPLRPGDILRTVSLLALAFAIVYLGYGLHRVVDTAEPLVAGVTQLSTEVEATRAALAPVIDATPATLETLDRIRENVPDLLRELEGYRALAPKALDEVAAIRAEVPALLDAVGRTQEQIDSLRSDLPRILELSQEAIETIRATDDALEQGIGLVPEVLAESRALRETIPPSLDRLDDLVEGASRASRDAGRGVWRGLVRGVLSTPLDLLRDAEQALLSREVYDGKASNDDFEYINEITAALLAGDGEKERSWVNPETGNGGRVQILGSFEREGLECRRLDVTLQPRNGEPEDFSKDVCRNPKGTWEVVEGPS